MLRRMFTLAGCAGLMAVAAVAAACTDNTNQIPTEVPSSAADVQFMDMKYALLAIEDLRIHELDTDAQQGTIDNDYVPTARTLARITGLTNWNGDLADEASELHLSAVALLQTLESGDADVKGASQKVHEGWHMFMTDAWAVVAKRLPPEAGGPKQGGEQDSAGHDSPFGTATASSDGGSHH